MSEYKRLKEKLETILTLPELPFEEDLTAVDCKQMYDILCKIEQGKMIELDMKIPFKVGDTAYWLNGLPNCIQEYKVLGYSFDCFCGLRVDLGIMQPILFRCFGVNLFASREKAEKRLKELQNG
jgi:hypothetical protein